MSARIMFVVQYFPYQYNQFKLLIDKLDADVYYKSNLDLGGADNRVLPRKLVYDLDGNEYDLDMIKAKGYDYMIYTGPDKDYIETLAKTTRYQFTIYLSHSLMGTQYDISIAMPYEKHCIGVMPGLWTNFDSFEHNKYLWRLKNRSWRFVESKSNPIVAEVLINPPKVEVEKDGAVIINCARGKVVDEEALLKALNSGKLAGAGIDVFEQEPSENMALINHERVSVTPHIGASTKEAQERIGKEVAAIVIDFNK